MQQPNKHPRSSPPASRSASPSASRSASRSPSAHKRRPRAGGEPPTAITIPRVTVPSTHGSSRSVATPSTSISSFQSPLPSTTTLSVATPNNSTHSESLRTVGRSSDRWRQHHLERLQSDDHPTHFRSESDEQSALTTPTASGAKKPSMTIPQASPSGYILKRPVRDRQARRERRQQEQQQEQASQEQENQIIDTEGEASTTEDNHSNGSNEDNIAKPTNMDSLRSMEDDYAGQGSQHDQLQQDHECVQPAGQIPHEAALHHHDFSQQQRQPLPPSEQHSYGDAQIETQPLHFQHSPHKSPFDELSSFIRTDKLSIQGPPPVHIPQSRPSATTHSEHESSSHTIPIAPTPPSAYHRAHLDRARPNLIPPGQRPPAMRSSGYSISSGEHTTESFGNTNRHQRPQINTAAPNSDETGSLPRPVDSYDDERLHAYHDRQVGYNSTDDGNETMEASDISSSTRGFGLQQSSNARTVFRHGSSNDSSDVMEDDYVEETVHSDDSNESEDGTGGSDIDDEEDFIGHQLDSSRQWFQNEILSSEDDTTTTNQSNRNSEHQAINPAYDDTETYVSEQSMTSQRIGGFRHVNFNGHGHDSPGGWSAGSSSRQTTQYTASTAASSTCRSADSADLEPTTTMESLVTPWHQSFTSNTEGNPSDQSFLVTPSSVASSQLTMPTFASSQRSVAAMSDDYLQTPTMRSTRIHPSIRELSEHSDSNDEEEATMHDKMLSFRHHDANVADTSTSLLQDTSQQDDTVRSSLLGDDGRPLIASSMKSIDSAHIPNRNTSHVATTSPVHDQQTPANLNDQKQLSIASEISQSGRDPGIARADSKPTSLGSFQSEFSVSLHLGDGRMGQNQSSHADQRTAASGNWTQEEDAAMRNPAGATAMTASTSTLSTAMTMINTVDGSGVGNGPLNEQAVPPSENLPGAHDGVTPFRESIQIPSKASTMDSQPATNRSGETATQGNSIASQLILSPGTRTKQNGSMGLSGEAFTKSPAYSLKSNMSDFSPAFVNPVTSIRWMASSRESAVSELGLACEDYTPDNSHHDISSEDTDQHSDDDASVNDDIDDDTDEDEDIHMSSSNVGRDGTLGGLQDVKQMDLSQSPSVSNRWDPSPSVLRHDNRSTSRSQHVRQYHPSSLSSFSQQSQTNSVESSSAHDQPDTNNKSGQHHQTQGDSSHNASSCRTSGPSSSRTGGRSNDDGDDDDSDDDSDDHDHDDATSTSGSDSEQYIPTCPLLFEDSNKSFQTQDYSSGRSMDTDGSGLDKSGQTNASDMENSTDGGDGSRTNSSSDYNWNARPAHPIDQRYRDDYNSASNSFSSSSEISGEYNDDYSSGSDSDSGSHSESYGDSYDGPIQGFPTSERSNGDAMYNSADLSTINEAGESAYLTDPSSNRLMKSKGRSERQRRKRSSNNEAASVSSNLQTSDHSLSLNDLQATPKERSTAHIKPFGAQEGLQGLASPCGSSGLDFSAFTLEVDGSDAGSSVSSHSTTTNTNDSGSQVDASSGYSSTYHSQAFAYDRNGDHEYHDATPFWKTQRAFRIVLAIFLLFLLIDTVLLIAYLASDGGGDGGGDAAESNNNDAGGEDANGRRLLGFLRGSTSTITSSGQS